MCAPIALAGLQLATSFANSAAQAQDLKRQAREAERQALAEAKVATARAEFLRDDVERESATARAQKFAGGLSPQSESIVASLAEQHARSLDGVKSLQHDAQLSLYKGRQRAQQLLAARRQAITRSLLGSATTLFTNANSPGTIVVPW